MADGVVGIGQHGHCKTTGYTLHERLTNPSGGEERGKEEVEVGESPVAGSDLC